MWTNPLQMMWEMENSARQLLSLQVIPYKTKINHSLMRFTTVCDLQLLKTGHSGIVVTSAGHMQINSGWPARNRCPLVSLPTFFLFFDINIVHPFFMIYTELLFNRLWPYGTLNNLKIEVVSWNTAQLKHPEKTITLTQHTREICR